MNIKNTNNSQLIYKKIKFTVYDEITDYLIFLVISSVIHIILLPTLVMRFVLVLLVLLIFIFDLSLRTKIINKRSRKIVIPLKIVAILMLLISPFKPLLIMVLSFLLGGISIFQKDKTEREIRKLEANNTKQE